MKHLAGYLKPFLALGALMAISSVSKASDLREARAPYVRIAELDVDATQLERFKAAVQEVGAASVRLEPGCLVLYAVAEKDNPSHVKVFEMYRDPDAYQSHLKSEHFKKFRADTVPIIKSRRLIDMIPLSLAAKTSQE
jgi:quinol monooxygenase YgiN